MFVRTLPSADMDSLDDVACDRIRHMFPWHGQNTGEFDHNKMARFVALRASHIFEIRRSVCSGTDKVTDSDMSVAFSVAGDRMEFVHGKDVSFTSWGGYPIACIDVDALHDQAWALMVRSCHEQKPGASVDATSTQ